MWKTFSIYNYLVLSNDGYCYENIILGLFYKPTKNVNNMNNHYSIKWSISPDCALKEIMKVRTIVTVTIAVTVTVTTTVTVITKLTVKIFNNVNIRKSNINCNGPWEFQHKIITYWWWKLFYDFSKITRVLSIDNFFHNIYIYSEVLNSSLKLSIIFLVSYRKLVVTLHIYCTQVDEYVF